MKCAKTRKLISMAIDGELSPRLLKALDAHLRGCESCRAVKERWLSYGSVLRDVETEVPPVEVVCADVLREIRQQRSGIPAPVRFFFGSHPAWVGATVVLVLLAVAVTLLWRPAGIGPVAAETGTEVEWVATELPGAMSMVYEDEDTGLTVIWVITDEDEDNGKPT